MVEQNLVKNLRLRGLATILLYFGGRIVISSIIILVLTAISNKSAKEVVDSSNTLIFFISSILILLVVILINLRDLKVMVKNQLVKTESYKYALMITGSYFLILFIAGLIISLITPSVPTSDNQAAIISMIFNSKAILTFSIIVIFAPITEEIVFRYSMVNLFRINSNGVLRIVPYIIASFAFVFIHDLTLFTNPSMESFIKFMLYFIPSIILCLGYMKSKDNLVTVILVHAAINIVSFINIINS